MSKVERLRDNINSLDIRLSGEQLEALDAANAPTQKMLYSLFTPPMRQHAVFGGSAVRAWAE